MALIKRSSKLRAKYSPFSFKEFIEKAEELLEDRAVYTSLTKNALDYVQKNHSVESEEKAYLDVINKMKEIIQ